VPTPRRGEPAERAYVAAWAANMSANLAPVLAPGARARGGFAAACWTHTSFSAARPIVKGLNFQQAAAAWYAGEGEYKVADDCAGLVECNPTCPPAGV
jgi:hypothetical protein